MTLISVPSPTPASQLLALVLVLVGVLVLVWIRRAISHLPQLLLREKLSAPVSSTALCLSGNDPVVVLARHFIGVVRLLLVWLLCIGVSPHIPTTSICVVIVIVIVVVIATTKALTQVVFILVSMPSVVIKMSALLVLFIGKVNVVVIIVLIVLIVVVVVLVGILLVLIRRPIGEQKPVFVLFLVEILVVKIENG